MDNIHNTSLKKSCDFVNNSQWWTEQEIDQYQTIKLKQIIIHSYANVPYYRKLFNSLNLKPDDIKSRDDFKKIPILKRDDIKKNFVDLQATNIKKYHPLKGSTGGTTGVPLNYYIDKDSWSLHWALKFRAWNWAGYNAGDKVAIMAGASLIPDTKVPLYKKIWIKFNNFYPMSMTHFDSYDLNKYIEIIKRENIKIIRGYPTAIASFADYINKNKIKINIKSLITTAEVLQKKHRKIIEETFDLQVFDNYGCADGGANASECDNHNGMHVASESSMFEIINSKNVESENGEIGEIIITSLTNYAMPIIRYAPSDLAIKSSKKCSCGRSHLLLEKIIGRTTDIIKFSNGRILGGPAFTLIFRNFNIKQYQLIQNDKKSLDVLIIKDSNYSQDETDTILKTLKHHCGEEIDISIKFVSEIPTTKSGKFRFIISNL